MSLFPFSFRINEDAVREPSPPLPPPRASSRWPSHLGQEAAGGNPLRPLDSGVTGGGAPMDRPGLSDEPSLRDVVGYRDNVRLPREPCDKLESPTFLARLWAWIAGGG